MFCLIEIETYGKELGYQVIIQCSKIKEELDYYKEILNSKFQDRKFEVIEL